MEEQMCPKNEDEYSLRSQTDSNLQDVFYVLPDEITYFQQLTSPVRRIDVSSIALDTSYESVMNALKYRFPLKYLGKQAEQLIVLCIPARQLIIKGQLTQKNSLPLLIKTKNQAKLKGVKSGRRSALIVQQNKLIRYKGCGNDGDGFVYQQKQLRGSHFHHTAKRELHMTNMINKILVQEIGERSANNPLFFYEFPRSIEHLSLKNDLKLLSKYCCVFQTKGDRRVGTHLISPLQILFLNIVDASGIDLQNYFTEKGRLDKYGLTELLVDYELCLEKGEIFLQKYDKGHQFQNYVSLKQINALGELKQTKDFEAIVSKISKKFIKKSRVEISNLLRSNVNWIPIMQIILQKVGWQMGRTKRIFCERNINWGFFNDHGHWHCNAHLNNFILKKPNTKSDFKHPAELNFILPLDFDLAFTKDQFINIDLDSPQYGQPDDDTFQLLLLSEYNAMQTSISGVEIMNFTYSIDLEKEGQPSLLQKMLRVVFRDTILRSFRWGMRRNKAQYQRINLRWCQNIELITPLVEGCLHISAQFQT